MGSLFQLCEYWSTSLPDSECSPSAFIVGNVDNEGADKIVIGTFSGKLQVWKPSSSESDPNDLLYERQFEEPILQLICAEFEEVTDGMRENLLAILFPHKIVFARLFRLTETIKFPENEGCEKENVVLFYFYNFEIYFEAELTHSSFNMTAGKFGRASNLLVCVQGLDGYLSFVDPHKVLFCGFLPSNQFLIPGHLGYAADRDLLITNNSSMFLMCYSFPSIFTAFHKDSANDTSSIPTSLNKKTAFGDGGLLQLQASQQASSSLLLPTWTFNIGEDTVGIEVCTSTTSATTSGAPRSFLPSTGTSTSVMANRMNNKNWWRGNEERSNSVSTYRGMEFNQQNTVTSIVVLSLYHVYLFSTSGACLHSQKLDVEGISLKSYHVQSKGIDNILVGTASGSILVFSSKDLVWSAKIPSTTALGTGVGNLCGAEGMIAVLGANNTITVNYLGTDPVDTPLKLVDSRVQKYSEMLEEIESLHAITKEVDRHVKHIDVNKKLKKKNLKVFSSNSASSSVTQSVVSEGEEKKNSAVISGEGKEVAKEVKEEGKEYIQVDVTFSSVVREAEYNTVRAKLVIFLNPQLPLDSTASDILVQFQIIQPIQVTPPTVRLESLERRNPFECYVDIAPGKDEAVNMIPSSLRLLVVVSGEVHPTVPSFPTSDMISPSYSNTFFTQRQCMLPFALVASPMAVASKSLSYSLQLNTDKTVPPSLLHLFSDLACMGSFTANALGVEYCNGERASVLVSKLAGRFKIKSTSMEGLWLLFSTLVSRIQQYYKEQGETVELELLDPMPLTEYIAVVEKHQSLRKEVEVGETRLEQAAIFHRIAEKRLLSRLKEVNPCNTNALELLLTESHYIIQDAMERLASAKPRLLQACAALNACSQLFSTCLSIKAASTISEKDSFVLQSLFQCKITADTEEMWEEGIYDVFRAWRKRIEGITEATPLSLDQLGGLVSGTSENVESPDEYKLSRLQEHMLWLITHLMEGKPLL